MTRRIMIVGAAMALAVLPALPAQAGGYCQEGEATEGSGERVVMKQNCYGPTVLRVDEGTTVTWVNLDHETHTITSAGGVWSNAHEEIVAQGRRAYTFEENGVYAYACLVHPGMTGVVVVGDGSGSGGVTGTVDAAEVAGDVDEEAEEVADVSDVEDAGEESPMVPGLIGGVAVAAGSAAGFGLGRRRRPTA